MSREFSPQTHFSFFAPNISKLERIRKGILRPEWQGTCQVYLLHFHDEIGSENTRGRAQHYIGMVASPYSYVLQKRLYCHKKGYANGSRLTRAFFIQGIGFEVGHIWTGVNAQFERIVKDLHKSWAVCEVCADIPFFDNVPTF